MPIEIVMTRERTAIVFSPHCREHDTGVVHPEQSTRLDWIVEMLIEENLDGNVEWLEPKDVSVEWIETVHTSGYRAFVEEACLMGRSTLDFGETLISEESYSIAMISVGSAIAAVDAVMAEGYRNAFSLARPPGHHARPSNAMGFCVFNNIAIAAKYAQQHYGLRRVVIIDWDVHHGNGTQEMFYADGSVLFISLHESPLYPHTGSSDEQGIDEGFGATLNIPLKSGTRGADYLNYWEEQVAPAVIDFKPEMILISAGFDAHIADPLGGLCLDSGDFYTLTKAAGALADVLCDGRLVSGLEGGYDRRGMPESAAAHVRALIELSES